MKYKQKYIPQITIQERKNLVAYVKREYTLNVQGKNIKNADTGLTIYFGSDGKAELLHGRALYAKKAALVQCLPQLLQLAEYSNFGTRKNKDEKNVFGYANFNAKVYIDGKLENVHIAVVVKSSGKAYYCHEINIKNEFRLAELDTIAFNARGRNSLSHRQRYCI